MARRAARAVTSRLSEEELNHIWRKASRLSEEELNAQAGFDSLHKEFPSITWKDRQKHFLEIYGPKVIENSRRRSELLHKTDWFDAGPWNARDLLPKVGSISACGVNPRVESAAKSAIRTLNKQLAKEKKLSTTTQAKEKKLSTTTQAKEKKECLRVQGIIRVTRQLVCGLMYFITIKASDGNFYEAKVHHDIDKRCYTLLMRIAKHYPVTDLEVLQLKVSEAGSSAGLGASGSGRGRQPRG